MQPAAGKHQAHTLLFWLVVALALALRIYNLDVRDIWLDEAFTWNQVRMSFSGMLDSVTNDVHPPLYQTLLWVIVSLFGDSIIALRMPSVVFSMIAVVLTYLITLRLASSRAALIAMGFAALSTFQLWYAQEARMYSLTAALSLWSFYELIRLWQSERSPVMYILSSILLLYSHVYGVFILAAQNCFYLITLAQRTTPAHLTLKRWVLLQLTIGLCYLPWLLVQIQQIQFVQSGFWIQKPSWSAPLATVMAYQSVLLPAFFVCVAAAVFSLFRTDSRIRTLLLCWLLIPVLVPFFASMITQPFFVNRYTIGASFAWYILVAIGISRLPKIPGGIVAAIVLGVMLAQLPEHYSHRAGIQTWQDTVAYIESNATDKDAIIFHADYMSLPYEYRSAMDADEFIRIESGLGATPPGIAPDDLTDALQEKNNVWLVTGHIEALKIPVSEVTGAIKRSHQFKEEKSFGPVTVYSYQP